MWKYFDDLSNFDGTILNPKDVFNWIFTIENFIIDNVLEEKHVKYLPNSLNMFMIGEEI